MAPANGPTAAVIKLPVNLSDAGIRLEYPAVALENCQLGLGGEYKRLGSASVAASWGGTQSHIASLWSIESIAIATTELQLTPQSP